MKIKLIISYNGSSYEGSQVQKHTQNTVMGKIYEALENLNIHTKLHASGRTDSGVHAFKQVLHFEIPPFWKDIKKLRTHLQNQLPSSIHIRSLSLADEAFHARYSAKRRTYRYILSNETPNPFEVDFISFIKINLHVETLEEAIKVFEGTHDFNMFKKNGGADGSTIRTIFKTRVYIRKNKTILYFEANGFLRSQIRLMVAFLLKINNNELSINDLKQQLQCKKNYKIKPAPPNGLYLSNIIY